MRTESLSLPGCLGKIFDAVYETPPSGDGWGMWQTALNIGAGEPEFLQRLSLVQAGCRKLLDEVSQLSVGEELSPRARQGWIASINRLNSLTAPSLLHDQAVNVKGRANNNDITMLEGMHNFFMLHNKGVKLPVDHMGGIIANIDSLIETIKTSSLEHRTKTILIKLALEMKFYIENIRYYDLDNAWSATSTFAGSTVRFGSEINSCEDKELGETLRSKVWEVMNFLAVCAGSMDGLGLLAAGAQHLLGTSSAH